MIHKALHPVRQVDECPERRRILRRAVTDRCCVSGPSPPPPTGLKTGGGVVQVWLRAPRRRGVRGLRPGHEEDGVRHQPHQRQGDQGEARRQEQGQAVAFHQEQEQGNALEHDRTHTSWSSEPLEDWISIQALHFF